MGRSGSTVTRELKRGDIRVRLHLETYHCTYAKIVILPIPPFPGLIIQETNEQGDSDRYEVASVWCDLETGEVWTFRSHAIDLNYGDAKSEAVTLKRKWGWKIL